MLVLLHELTVPANPLNVTPPVPCVAPKPVPAIVTKPPIGAVVGARLSEWKIEMLRFFVAVAPTESSACTVKLESPPVAGVVPEMTPVLEFSVRPLGSAPAVIDHV